MLGGILEPVLAFWSGWSIHFTVLVSFTVQVTLLLASDFRRRRDWAWLKALIWSAYMLADTAAIYALGHMSVLCNWSPERQLMAVWAPLLLVHLGGQDNITAYAIEDNRLWLRHLQTFLLQVAAAFYVLYVSSILSHPLSKLSLAAILMFVVGVLKYLERIWALKRSNSCASSSLSATSYDKAVSGPPRTTGHQSLPRAIYSRKRCLMEAYLLLDVPKQMFEGPTSYVQIRKSDNRAREARHMLNVVEIQMSMMYDLLYTKADVVHTWYGLCSRAAISLPFTIAALALFRSSSLLAYKRADVVITNVLLIGAVVLEATSVLRAIFSKWTAVLLWAKDCWNTFGDVVFRVEGFVTTVMMRALVPSGSYLLLSGCMRQHSLFTLVYEHSKGSMRSKMAKLMGVEDWWDSSVYSWSTEVPKLAITKVLELVCKGEDITKSQGLNAVWKCMDREHRAVWIRTDDQSRQSYMNYRHAADWIWTEEELKLEERILVWHIATHVYLDWYLRKVGVNLYSAVPEAAMVLSNYMFFLLAARPYMLPYPVSRQAYVKLCHDAIIHLPRDKETLLDAILKQKEALLEGTDPLQLRRQGNGGGGADASAGATAQPQPSINATLDKGCQLAAKLIHITGHSPDEFSFSVNNVEVVLPKIGYEDVAKMVLEVWAEMLCYTANLCNENYHAKHLTDGGEFMTIIALLMIYAKNGFISRNTTTTRGTAAGPSSSQSPQQQPQS